MEVAQRGRLVAFAELLSPLSDLPQRASILAKGVSMKEIQHILLHASMVTTDRYVRRLGQSSGILAAAFDAFDASGTSGKIIPFRAVGK